MAKARKGAYTAVIERVFKNHYRKNSKRFDFKREELIEVCEKLGVEVPKNVGDIIYNYRYRRKTMPPEIAKRCPEGEEWIIRGVGSGEYRFRRVPIANIQPQEGRYLIKVPDATPEIVAHHALSDEQALLAKLRYNRLIDLFTGLVTYSLQNHLRTQVSRVQIEVDELYLGVAKSGAQYVLPVQAKGGSDRLGRVQLEQDLDLCAGRFPQFAARAIGAQFLYSDDVIVLFELAIIDDEVKIVEERHYQLVPAKEISDEDLEFMRERLRDDGSS